MSGGGLVMKMKMLLSSSLLIALILEPGSASSRGSGVLSRKETRHEEIRRIIAEWYPAEASKYTHFNQLRKTQQRLLQIAKESPESRNDVIDALLRTLEEPRVRAFIGYRLLWLLVCDSLGKLRATRGIDTLVELLDADDGITGIPVENRPAVKALIQIGEPAVGKLAIVVVAPNSSRKTRMRAAEALAGIGGPTATTALRRALETEKDDVVRSNIEVFLRER